MKIIDLAKRLDTKVEYVLKIIRETGVEANSGEDELEISTISKIVHDIYRLTSGVNKKAQEKKLDPSLIDLALHLNAELDQLIAEARYHGVKLNDSVNAGNTVMPSLPLSVKARKDAHTELALLRMQYVIAGIIVFFSIVFLLLFCFTLS
ncbi:MAG: hypothetical protein WDL87_01770 [Candidatus Omnitrophota bacterium]|jgi:hypothetical protein